MIVFVMTRRHMYTHDRLRSRAEGFRAALTTYPDLFGTRELPRATYVFTDLDRLTPAAKLEAAGVYRRLRERKVTALNDPARVASRFELLRRLYLAGINHFNAYRVADGVRPERWPVFLRHEGEHRGPLSGLLEDWDAVQRHIDGALAGGASLDRLIVVEFAAQPVRPGLYRKLSTYRIGGTSFADTCVHDPAWVAKIGKDGIAPPELYEEELQIVRENPHGEIVAQAFDIAGVDYGRADFGLVDDKPQIYEINTNPNIELLGDSPSPFRSESRRLCNSNYMDALRRIDTPDEAGSVEI